MQNDYCHPNGFYAKKDAPHYMMNDVADKIVDYYKKLETNNICTVCFSIVYEGGNNPCVKDTWGAGYYKIKPHRHYYKTKFSCFTNGDFCEFLKIHHITQIYICGFQTTFCVNETLREAVFRGFNVVLIEDLIGERIKHFDKIESVLTFTKNNGRIVDSKLSFLELKKEVKQYEKSGL